MNEAELQAIRERADRATPGEWHTASSEFSGRRIIVDGDANRICGIYGVTDNRPQMEANAAFVAYARTDIPALLDAVDELIQLRAENARLQARADECCGALDTFNVHDIMNARAEAERWTGPDDNDG